jgi:hypothetical protein
LYGAHTTMERFWARAELEDISLPNGAKALASSPAGIVSSEILSRLAPAFRGEGISLAPLTDGDVSNNGRDARARLPTIAIHRLP